MVSQNSLVQFVLQLQEAYFIDMAQFYPELQRDFKMDWQTCQRRMTCEGLGFATKTLPALAKSFDAALQGDIPLQPTGFSVSRGMVIPKFLRGLLGMVFSQTTGRILENPSISAIRDIRQFLYMFYKLEMPYESSTLERYTSDFTSVDSALPVSSSGLCDNAQRILSVARALVTGVFRELTFEDIIPKHGPGEVATGEKPHEKINLKRRFSQLDIVFPFEEWFMLWSRFVDEAEDSQLQLETVEEGSSRLCFVPKDSRGPRLIAMEPLEYMWIQQGIKALLYDHIESHPLTKGHVNFTDQEINRELALKASRDQSLVTLDMKEASDRISLWLVKELFRDCSILEALLATRTPKVQLPNGEFHFYKKFAPMGSALCFPIEAIVHWALAASAMSVVENVPLTLATRQVWVYGDDIIVHKDLYTSLLQYFPHFGLRFNEKKCCTQGYFRESCGMDAFMGEQVTPVKIKKLPPVSRVDSNSIIAFINQSNNLWELGYYHMATALQLIVERIIGVLPVTTSKCEEFLGWYTRVGISDPRVRRWNKNLQCWMKRSWIAKAPDIKVNPDNWSEVLRCVLPHDESLRAGKYTRRYKLHLQRRFTLR